EAGVPEIDLCARLLDYLNRIARAAHGAHPADSLDDRTELRPGRAVEPKAELGPAARIVDRASTANERLARRATEIDTGSPGQPLLGHRDAVPSRCCGHCSDEASRPAAENHQIVLTACSVGPTRRVALLDRLLVVNVRGEKFDSRHHASSLDVWPGCLIHSSRLLLLIGSYTCTDLCMCLAGTQHLSTSC